ncbi:AraC family transcriptional regulator [Pedobacter yonginense]|uniref:AraC family transcriptional regulator n=1 Tax=Pedobacter yonginense TaxID=651869 RepID=A0A317ETX9_9SPHI|nr:helix-turn-helix domain-containing protein [Pedobacter yonginense]PWS29279.1 AraC family transcriptional regulator [Pedobacter yonginense]
MQIPTATHNFPIYHLEPDETGNQHFRVYNFTGTLPQQTELLIPHRKDHFLIVLVRKAGTRQWIDLEPFILKDNTVYFSGPENIIVKEEFKELWSTGLAFTSSFVSLHGGEALLSLPLIQNVQNGHELLLSEKDLGFIEDLLLKINAEYQQPNEWQQRMLMAYLSLLLTYLSKLYTEQFKVSDCVGDQIILKKFHAKIDECFQQCHEVGDYASMLNISAGHLSELVKTQSGKPAIKHIHDRLVLEARRLLFHTAKSSKEIAYDLGFSDASYFNRFFKRETSTTPAGYRNQIREMYH